MSFDKYLYKQAQKEAAYNLYNYAGAKLELTQIQERLAEIDSQHEPMASLLEEKMTERQRLYAIAFYVVVGRMPEPIPK